MNNQRETIRKFVSYINNPAHLGGFWLPNIQRPFVWSEEQIERLYDSIMREYPIGTLLVWKNKSRIRHRKFIDNWKSELNLNDFYVPENELPKMLVLDGQQRMQSLFIGLKGSYNGRQLYFNILSGDIKAPDDRRFEFKFYEKSPGYPWMLFKDLVFSDKKKKEYKQQVEELAGRTLDEEESDRFEDNFELVRKEFCTDDNILYQEVDSIDRPNTYSEDDIVEIFIRANSGGTRLDKSDLLFSLLVSAWDEADENMFQLLDELNRDGFAFGRDFVLKTCLALFNKGAAYKVEKFRDGDTRKKIEENWQKISDSIRDVKDFLYGKTFVRSDKVLSSYLVLIPLIYFRYHYPNNWSRAKGLNEYIVRTLLSSSFSGSPDILIDRCIGKINELQDFDLREIFGVIRDQGRALEMSAESLLDISYTDKRIHLIFNLWYDFNYDPAYIQNEPQLDHIFPQSLLRSVKMINPETGKKNLTRYKQSERDQLANMMLLTRAENGAGAKGDTTPAEWFKDKEPDYLDKHLVPSDPELWKLENFEQFIEERKKLILKKFEYLIIKN